MYRPCPRHVRPCKNHVHTMWEPCHSQPRLPPSAKSLGPMCLDQVRSASICRREQLVHAAPFPQRRCQARYRFAPTRRFSFWKGSGCFQDCVSPFREGNDVVKHVVFPEKLAFTKVGGIRTSSQAAGAVQKPSRICQRKLLNLLNRCLRLRVGQNHNLLRRP
jgi:hypothetical protein